MTIKTLRKRAHAINYRVTKGFQRYLNGANGGRGSTMLSGDHKRLSGYMVQDLQTGMYEAGCFTGNLTHQFDLEDVETCLKALYKERNLKW